MFFSLGFLLVIQFVLSIDLSENSTEMSTYPFILDELSMFIKTQTHEIKTTLDLLQTTNPNYFERTTILTGLSNYLLNVQDDITHITTNNLTTPLTALITSQFPTFPINLSNSFEVFWHTYEGNRASRQTSASLDLIDEQWYSIKRTLYCFNSPQTPIRYLPIFTQFQEFCESMLTHSKRLYSTIDQVYPDEKQHRVLVINAYSMMSEKFRRIVAIETKDLEIANPLKNITLVDEEFKGIARYYRDAKDRVDSEVRSYMFALKRGNGTLIDAVRAMKVHSVAWRAIENRLMSLLIHTTNTNINTFPDK